MPDGVYAPPSPKCYYGNNNRYMSKYSNMTIGLQLQLPS